MAWMNIRETAILTCISCSHHGNFFSVEHDQLTGTGLHFNPLNKAHGAPTDDSQHAGDLGNMLAGQDGVAEVDLIYIQIPLTGLYSVLGWAVIVLANRDDLGRGGNEESKNIGHAGAGVRCSNLLCSILTVIWYETIGNNFLKESFSRK